MCSDECFLKINFFFFFRKRLAHHQAELVCLTDLGSNLFLRVSAENILRVNRIVVKLGLLYSSALRTTSSSLSPVVISCNFEQYTVNTEPLPPMCYQH